MVVGGGGIKSRDGGFVCVSGYGCMDALHGWLYIYTIYVLYVRLVLSMHQYIALTSLSALTKACSTSPKLIFTPSPSKPYTDSWRPKPLPSSANTAPSTPSSAHPHIATAPPQSPLSLPSPQSSPRYCFPIPAPRCVPPCRTGTPAPCSRSQGAVSSPGATCGRGCAGAGCACRGG